MQISCQRLVESYAAEIKDFRKLPSGVFIFPPAFLREGSCEVLRGKTGLSSHKGQMVLGWR